MNFAERALIGFANTMESLVAWWQGLFTWKDPNDEVVVIVYDNADATDISYVIGPFDSDNLNLWINTVGHGVVYQIRPLIRTWLTPDMLADQVRKHFEDARDRMKPQRRGQADED